MLSYQLHHAPSIGGFPLTIIEPLGGLPIPWDTPKSSIFLRDFPLKILKTIQLLCYDCVVSLISSSMGPTPNGVFPGSAGCWDSHLKSPVPEVQAAISGQWNKKTPLGLVKLRVMGESVGYPWISMDQRSAQMTLMYIPMTDPWCCYIW